MQDTSQDTPQTETQDAPPPPQVADENGEELANQTPQEIFFDLRDWAIDTWDQLLSLSTIWQILAVIAAICLGWIASRRPQKSLEARRDKRDSTDIIYRIYNALAGVMWPVCIVVFLWIAVLIFGAAGLPDDILRIVASLLEVAVTI